MAEELAMEVPGSPQVSDSLSSKSAGFEKAKIDSGVLNTDGLPNLLSSPKSQEGRKMSDIFKEGLNLYDNISNSDEPTNSVETQAKVRKAMNLFEDVTRLVSSAALFSRNENVEEIPTSSIKYLILPYLLGNLALKLCVDDRIEVVRTAEVYFRDFLQRCKDYSVAEFDIPEQDDEGSEELSNPSEPRRSFDLMAMARDRNLKLQRYKEQKELESKIKELKAIMDSSTVSEEVERKFYLTLNKLYINLSFDEVSSLTMEKRMLAHMAKVKKDLPSDKQERRDKPRRYEKKPLMPIIITRDEVQKKVYGAGYPSLPTMTVAEFFDKKVADGEFPDPSKPPPRNALQDRAPVGALAEVGALSEAEMAEKEDQEEADDPNTLRQTREWDEWKDDHRRGWGNRMNRS